MIRPTMTSLVLAVLLLTTACGTTIQPGQRGLFWRPFTEGLSPETLKDGYYWQAPWNNVYRYDIRWQSFTEDIDALSADDLQVLIKAAIILRPIPEELYFLAQDVGVDFYPRIVKPQFMATVRSVVSGYNMVTVPEKSAEIASRSRYTSTRVARADTDRGGTTASVATAAISSPRPGRRSGAGSA